MSEQLPHELFRFGAPIAEFSSKGRASSLLRNVAIGFGVVVVGIILEVIGLSGLGILVAVMGGIFMVLRGAALIGLLLGGTRRVLVFDEGVGVVKGDQVTAMHWSEVNEIYQDIYTYRVNLIPVVNRHNHTLHSVDGRELQLTRRIHEIEKLGPMLHQAVTKHKMPIAVDTLKSGGTVNFGPIAISNQGMTFRKKLIPWDEIKGVRIQNGTIMVNRAGKFMWGGAQASQIPNLYLFLALADQIVGVNR
ncbi:MAG: hypothetical protein JXB07_03990 [Anaerolineae bacterium]|nr:hypothetical protein [Anaerolineae bacterium]